jgi:hypothetical protein
MAQWLAARFGITQRTAAEWVRVGRKLVELPRIRRAFASRLTSGDQLTAVTRIAAAEDDADWADRASGMSVADSRRHGTRASTAASQSAHRYRYLQYWWDEHDPVLHLRGTLPDAQGVVVAKALDLFAHDMLPNPEYRDDQYGIYDDYETCTAGALTRMASQALGTETDADRATVVIHVRTKDLASAGGQGEAEDGPALPGEIVRRFACDARIQAALEGPEGQVAGVERTTRTIPPWMARQIKLRDRACRFPGCERTRCLHRHHIRHWADGGCTDLCNLITLCLFHHQLIHEGGWHISGDPNGEINWVRPNGSIFNPRPFPMTSIHRRLAVSKAED